MSRSDLVLLAYVFLIVPAMLVGFFFARRKMFEPYHKFTMTTITIVNWFLIFFIMAGTYQRDVAPQVPQNLGLPSVLIPTLHAAPGLIAQLLATYLVIRMWFDPILPNWFKVNNIKPYMRLTLGLWLTTAVIGVLTWAVINKGLFASTPAVTPDASSNVVQLISGNKIEPAELTIPVGTTVEFINIDTRSHTVTADDGSFASGDMKTNASFKHTFTTPGDILYFCDYHGDKGHVGMSAVIHVTGDAPVSVPTTQASAEPTTAPTLAPTTEATEQGSASNAQVVTVTMTDDVFEPSEITVAAGTVIRWENKGKRRHTITADDGSFDSGQIAVSASFEKSFDTVGEVSIYCANHGDKGHVGMSMVVKVTEASAAATSESASAAPTSSSAQPSAVTDSLALLVVSASDTPGNAAYVIGAQNQMSIIKAQSELITEALTDVRYEDAQAAAEAILNAIEGGEGTDRDNDGKVQQLGDSYGLRNYIFSINETADTLEKAADGATKSAATGIKTTGRDALTSLQGVIEQAQALLDAKTLVAAREVEPKLTEAVAKLNGDITSIVGSAAGFSVPDSRLTPVPAN